jgi:hypothetical protein
MSNHPNRSKGPKGPTSNPTPADIKNCREIANLTQGQAAALIYRSERNWQQWEGGERRMDPALWELFGFKTQGMGAGAFYGTFAQYKEAMAKGSPFRATKLTD